MLLVVIQLVVGDDAGFLPGVKFADLLQGQQFVDLTGGVLHHIFFRQGVRFHHAAGHHDGAHVLQPADAHEHGGHGLVTAGDEHAAVVHAGVGLGLHQVDDGIPVGQGVVDSVVALGDSVAHVRGVIPGGLAPVFVDRLNRLLHETVQMGAAGMTVAVGAFHQNLGLAQIGNGPAHADFQRIVFRSQGPDLLRT